MPIKPLIPANKRKLAVMAIIGVSLSIVLAVTLAGLSNQFKEKKELERPVSPSVLTTPPLAAEKKPTEQPVKATVIIKATNNEKKDKLQKSTNVQSQSNLTKQEVIADTKKIMPVVGKVVMLMGWNFQPVYQEWRYHNGIDITAREGTKVMAAASGRVVKIYHSNDMGLTVIIKSGELEWLYSSLKESFVTTGDFLNSGDIVGLVGECSAEPFPHLHLAVRKGDKFLDPQKLVM